MKPTPAIIAKSDSFKPKQITMESTRGIQRPEPWNKGNLIGDAVVAIDISKFKAVSSRDKNFARIS